MGRNEWMRGEIDSWRRGGVIDDALAETLSRRYPDTGHRMSWGTVLVGSFGALLVGLGVIALFAANWDCFGRPMRAAISTAPVVLCAAIAIFAAWRGEERAAVREPLGIAWAIAAGAAACLVAQTYQVGGSVPGLILLVALLTLPVAWVTSSATVMSLWPVYPVVWAFAKCDEMSGRGHFGVLACALFMMALSALAYVAYLRRRGERGPFVVVQFVTGLVYSVGLALVVIATMDFHWSAAWPYVYSFWGCAGLVGALGLLFRLPVWPWIATVVAALAASAFGVDDDAGNYVLSFAFAVAVAAYGVRRLRLGYVNVGAILAIWLVLAKFFASNVDFTVKGIVLVACGIALTVANVCFMHAVKSGRRTK